MFTEINLSNNNNLAIQVNYPGCEIAPSLQLKLLIMSSCNIEQNTLLKPKFLKSQVDLQVLDLSHNKLLGPSPNFLFLNNTKLKYLNLRNNSLVSAMNLQLYPKAPILAIDLSQNNIDGLIPNNISLMFPHLISLNISGNNFSGNVPLSLCKLSNMSFLDLSNNSFSGEIPNCIFTNCTSLWILKLSDNNFNGTIFGVANKLPPSLTRLYLDGNNMTGSFPANLPTYEELSVLDLNGNQLSGPLPQSIGNLYHIRILNLAGNNLDGVIPHQLCNLTSLAYLDLTGNNFNGSMPFCSHPLNISSVYLSSNALVGSSPYHTFNFSTIEILDLSKNQFSGSLHWIGALEAIRLLSLRENQFEGTLSQNICHLNNLRILDLSANNLEGILPLCLFKLPFQAAPGYSDYFWELTNEFNMIGIDSSWEDVSIDVVYPTHDDLQHFSFATKGSFYNFSTVFFGLLSGVDLSRNKFSGLIPPGIRNTNPIQVLNLSHNMLTGPIPKTISHFRHIES
ncbi:Receptor-like protein 12 [Rhynchospora pubera]|uniref:Receptor-like protein 12 n=1 Tax=Rhynchospora pubera TaxID=906938 RepID=A0AAV8GF48_9POAL|nr:Receptor-like protein 12 [Rhynchospora pubera]